MFAVARNNGRRRRFQCQGGRNGSGRKDKENLTMDHSNHTRLSAAEQTESNLVGAPVYGADDSKVGTISHLHNSGSTGKAVVDVGGFLGIGSKPVLVSVNELVVPTPTVGV